METGDEFYHEHLKEKSKLTSDFLDLPQASYLKEWKTDGTVPLAITNRWELLTYHLNSIAKANRDYEIILKVIGTAKGKR